MKLNNIEFDRLNCYIPQKRYYNVPYGHEYDTYNDGKRHGYEQAKSEFEKRLELLENKLSNSTCQTKYDIPFQVNLHKESKLCGYIDIDGTYYKCGSCEHEKNIRQIIWNNEDYRDRYFNTPASFFDTKPPGMLQEEYFAMKILGFVKISSFKNTPNDMIVFRYNTLTYKQTDLIYPR